MADEKEELLEDVLRPGIELISYCGATGYQDETISLSNGVTNGLRIGILNDDLDGWVCFHIHSPETAKRLAEKLIEWSDRICNPPVTSE